ncbi:MAG: response regulator [Gammaproteobacteria bacterium]|jgi:signal transduction histidine kinase
MSQRRQQKYQLEEIFAMQILIVDDEPFNIALMEKILKRAGYSQIASTDDSRQAIAMCNQYRPDIVLLDLRMPEMDGFDVMRCMNESEALCDIPVIVLTAENNAENRMRALSKGAKDIISKPFDRNETLKRILNTLESRLLHKHLMEQNHDLDMIVQNRTQELQLEKQRLKALNDNLENLVAERTEDLQRANEELAQVNNTMSELVSIVSHELRTPLTAIKSFAEILRDEADNLERKEQENFLNIIDKESNRLTRLISDLLDLQKMQAGKMVWKSEILDITKVARETAALFSPAFANKDLELNVRIEIEGARILGDNDKIIQVFSNLLSNAMKFTEAGGVTIRLTRNPHWANAMLLSGDLNTATVLTTMFNEMRIQLTHFVTIEDTMAHLNCNGGNIHMAVVDLSNSESNAVNYLEAIRKLCPSLPVAIIINSGAEDKYQSCSWTGTLKKPIAPGNDTDYIEPLVTNLIGIAPATDMIDIAIIDSGIGIPAEELSKVFMQFHQIDSSQKREQRGTGLGLTICKEIVEHYGGKIWAESRPGQGSEFHMLLPELKENKKKLGEILIEKGIVTEKQLSEALKQQY